MYHVVGSNYGIHKSTVYLHINQTINALHDAMLHDYIRFPMGLELSRVFYDFEYICKLPQVAGAVDGCFIPMMKPPGPWGFRYWCYKNFTAILLLACVDARGVFTFIDVGKPSSVGDASVFNLSLLREKFCDANFSPGHNQDIEGVSIPPYLLADAAFPFLPTVMKLYTPDPAEHTPQWYFNYCHVRGRRVVENAFGRLKGRWWVCRQARLRDPDYLSLVVTVCCCLHNFLEIEQDVQFFDEWMDNDSGSDAEEHTCNRSERRAFNVRDALASFVWRSRQAEHLA